jgi:putative nucleotidyltransferase with HDIG domain
MKAPFSFLVTALAVVAALLYGWMLQQGAGTGPIYLPGVAAFVFVALLSEMLMAVNIRLVNEQHQPRASLAYLPFLAAIALFPPHISVGIVITVVLISQALLRRNSPLRLLYNVAQATITAGIPALFYHSFASGAEPAFAAVLFFLAALLFFVVNIVLTSVAVSWLQATTFRDVFSHFAGPNLEKLLRDAMAIPLVFGVILLYGKAGWLGVVGFLLPLLLLHRAFVTFEKLTNAHLDLVRVLVKAIETRDPYTSGHSERVATMAKDIALQMRFTASKVQMIERAALLHDIGKIDAEYSTFLRKPTELSPEERKIIQTHTIRGAAILNELSSMPPDVVAGVLYHHEWYDGKGYPHGIAGEAIPLAARIIMLCDSVDAMLSDRPYRSALSIEAVRSELSRCSGTQFDPAIVKAVLASDIIEKAKARTPPSVSGPRLQAAGLTS